MENGFLEQSQSSTAGIERRIYTFLFANLRFKIEEQQPFKTFEIHFWVFCLILLKVIFAMDRKIKDLIMKGEEVRNKYKVILR